tara:strand:+ start:3166 stop:3396 length:231 start_codon:yes stop_codon:yes gene_type:complete
MNPTEALAKDRVIMGKTIGIVRGLRSNNSLQIKFSIDEVIFQPAKGNSLRMSNHMFNKLDTNEIVKIIEGHIDGSK